jgi:hypothetical protein
MTAPRSRRRVVVAAAVAAALAGPWVAPAGAQQGGGRCLLEFRNTPTTRFSTQRIANTDQVNSYIGGGIVAFCSGQDVTLRSDSAEYYSGQQTLFLIGTVSYVEPRVRVNAQRMTYFQGEERLLAEGNVDAVLPSGTTMRGPLAEYFRDVPGVRPRSRLVAPGRPRFSIVQPNAAGAAGATGAATEPTALVADRVVTDGDSLVYASGRVEIDRSDVAARGDSAFLDGGREFARLLRAPSIQGKGERPFTLRGDVVDLFSRQRQLERVVASQRAEAVSDDLKLTSDTIDLRVTTGRLDRAYAWGRSRARAVSPDRDIIADSLDVQLPNQRVREVRALRGAYAATVADTARFRSTERDWLRGDTIVARFDSAAAGAPRDTAAKPRIRELEAIGNARSFYQLASQNRDAAGRPAVNYVTGRNITVAFDGQRAQTVTVRQQATGVYLEPGEPEGAPAAPAGRGAASPRPGAAPATAPGVTPPRPAAPRPAAPATPRPSGRS